MSLSEPALSTVADVRAWFDELHNAGIAFHPEDTFEATADLDSGRPTFTHAEASRLDSAMTTARTIADAHGEDICDIAMDSLMRARPDAA